MNKRPITYKQAMTLKKRISNAKENNIKHTKPKTLNPLGCLKLLKRTIKV